MSFQSFSLQHFIPWAIFFAVTMVSIRIGKNTDDPRLKRGIGLGLVTVAWLFMIVADIQKIADGTYSIQDDLPLFMCRLVTWLLPIGLILGHRYFLRIMYFWVMAGTIQAVLTPDLEEAFPHFLYFRYFILHFGLIAAIIYTVVVTPLKINWKDFWHALGWAQVYLIVLMVINYFLGSNYGYTQHKPPGGSVLDFFGPWPIYILGAEAVMIVMFLLLMLPFLKIKKSS